jgi:predicted esterase
MKSRGTLLALMAAILWSAASGAFSHQTQEFEAQYPTYEKMREKLGSLFQEQKYAEAASLLEWAFDKFPDKAYPNAFNLGLAYGRLGELQKGVDALRKALDRGLFFGKWDLEGAGWAPYSGFAPFEKIKDACEAARAEAEKKAVLGLEVVEPEGYDASKAYPLFIALHGGGENVAEFKPRWGSALLRKEFLVAYVQSTQVATMTGFHWQDESKTKLEVAEAYRRVAVRYKIKPDEIIIGGFSSGGFGSFICLFQEVVPAAGFVVLCPPVPETLRDEDILRAKKRGVRGSILTTELDTRLGAQRALADRFVRQGLDVRIVVEKNTGHWYPDSLADLIDKAIAHIRSGR